MKTDISKFIKCFAISFIALFFSTTLKAQAPSCTYLVVNPGSCLVTIDITYYDNGSAICSSLSSQTIAAASTGTFSCGGCNQPLTNIVVTLINVGGSIPTGPFNVDVNTTHVQGAFNTLSCLGQTNYTMDWFYNYTIIAY